MTRDVNSMKRQLEFLWSCISCRASPRSARACIFAGILCVPPAPLSAANIIGAWVRYSQPAYSVSFDVVLKASHDRVRQLVTDYENLRELSPTVILSTVVSSNPGGGSRVKLVLRPCFLIVFCKRITKVTDTSISDNGDVIHVTVPALSDFHQAREELSITADASDAKRTRLRYRAHLVPKFRTPPIIGPWFLRRQIIKELTVTARRVESLAQPM